MKAFVKFFIFFVLSSSAVSQWVPTSVPEGGGVTDMVVMDDGTIIVTTASFNWPTGQGGIRRSTDQGATWQNVVDVFNGRTLHLGSTGMLYASYWPFPQSEGMYMSTNAGLNWTLQFTAGNSNNIFSIVTKDNDNTIFIGTRTAILKRVGNGSWEYMSSGIPDFTFIYDLAIDESEMFLAAGTSRGAYVSTNDGANWLTVTGIPATDTILTVKFVTFLTEGKSAYLYAGSKSGKFFRAPPPAFVGHELEAFDYEIPKILSFDSPEKTTLQYITMLLSGSSNRQLLDPGFVYSTDMGVSWIQENGGLPASPRMSSITSHYQGGYMRTYVGLFENTVSGAKIFKWDMPIGIQQISGEVPDRFSISQNYPNPFNPATKIKFDVTKTSYVNITVFDVLGRQIATLVNEKLSAGTYETDWNAVNMPGGVYFYKLETESFTETKKMILIK